MVWCDKKSLSIDTERRRFVSTVIFSLSGGTCNLHENAERDREHESTNRSYDRRPYKHDQQILESQCPNLPENLLHCGCLGIKVAMGVQ